MERSHFPPGQGTFRKVENQGTVLEKSRHGRVYPAVFRTRRSESGRRPNNQLCPFHAVNK